MYKIYADMTVDLFHAGHVRFLESAKSLGDYLLVGVHSDEVNSRYKRPPIVSMQDRIDVVSGCRYVDEVIGNVPWIVSKELLEEHNIDLVVHAHPESEIKIFEKCYAYPMSIGKFKRLEYSGGITTSEIMRRVIERHGKNR